MSGESLAAPCSARALAVPCLFFEVLLVLLVSRVSWLTGPVLLLSSKPSAPVFLPVALG